jgi:perosamine synthetase
MKMIPHSSPFIAAAEIKAAAAVTASGRLATGEKAAELEKALCAKTGMRYGVAVNSGSAALHLALLSLGIKKGDAVILPDYGCAALLNAVLYTGATPVVADIEPDSPNLSFDSAKRKMDRRVKAIILPHLFGIAQDLSPFRRFGVPLIEDCAQAFGFKVNGKNVGGQGDISVFSFYATKLICAGEGGMVQTSDKRLWKTALDLREYDEKEDFRLRFNYKMSDLHAALALEQLKRLPEFIATRKAIARQYTDALGAGAILPFAEKKDNIYFRFILSGNDNAAKLIHRLEKAGIHARRPIFRLLSGYLGKSFCANSGKLQERAVSIPIYPAMAARERAKVVSALRRIFS